MANVILNNIDHADVRVDFRHAAAFGDAVNQVLVLPTEFVEAAREYPIFFRRDSEGAWQAVALLGLDRDDNLFLDARGRWDARYVPAVQRRGPFLIGFQDQGADRPHEPVIMVDLDDPRVGHGETAPGVPMFLPHGGNTPFLEQVTGVLRILHEGVEVAAAMYPAFERLGLLEPATLKITLDDAHSYVVPELHTLSEERLAELDGAALETLHRQGFLGSAFLVAASTANVARLIELANERRSAA